MTPLSKIPALPLAAGGTQGSWLTQCSLGDSQTDFVEYSQKFNLHKHGWKLCSLLAYVWQKSMQLDGGLSLGNVRQNSLWLLRSRCISPQHRSSLVRACDRDDN